MPEGPGASPWQYDKVREACDDLLPCAGASGAMLLATAIDAIDLDSDKSDNEVRRQPLSELASRSRAQPAQPATGPLPTRRWGRCFSATSSTAANQRRCDVPSSPTDSLVHGDDVLA